MNKYLGLWIDHRKAVLIFHPTGEEEIKTILSEVEKDPSSLIPEDSQDRKYQNQLNVYYDEVIALIHQVESLLIFGPGEAKGELNKRLEHKHPSGRTVQLETSDKLSDRQIAAHARAHFDKERCITVL
jgi:hypothetical protein